MRDSHLKLVAAVSLVIGAVLGMVGSFVSSAEWRGIAWGLDGIALVMGTALLTIHYMRMRDTQLAAGFLVFVAGQTLITSCSAMELSASSPLFGAGAGLWAAALALVSASAAMPIFVRITGAIASVLFAVTAVRIFGGTPLTPLSGPLPFVAYPFLVLTVFGWAWVHYRSGQQIAA